ncbi:NAD(P)-binding protein, partial [Xanthobacter wiegelii]|uniref:NAD(P)-binding protein n=1 Tax=Xanthobacter wiegelii TaxID=3119913 RepID=UPI003729A2BF
MNVRSTIRADREQQGDAAPESVFYDLIILGAGLSGLGAAHYFKKSFPEKTFAILDANSSYGGTWFTHRYPGVRSDSDLFNFGYKFKPWGGPPIASGAEILRYLGDLIAEDKMEPHINYGVRLLKADWSEERKHWTLAAEEVATGLTRVFETPFLWMCHGYYDHSRGYIPDWPGLSDFKGEVIHPQ